MLGISSVILPYLYSESRTNSLVAYPLEHTHTGTLFSRTGHFRAFGKPVTKERKVLTYYESVFDELLSTVDDTVAIRARLHAEHPILFF